MTDSIGSCVGYVSCYPPEIPTLTGIGANNQVLLAWNQPFDGNMPITDYVIEHSRNNGTSWTTILDTTTTVTAHTVEQYYPGCLPDDEPCIANGQAAMFRVRAVNSIGYGGWSVPVDATPAASSSIITNVTVTAGERTDWCCMGGRPNRGRHI